MLRVGMHFVTLCVTQRCSTSHPGLDAERPELHSHAEREER
ncbi:rplA family protein [Pseudomonas syringae pv. syringae]|nr:rplA family protein [Pseudomonas syringae pv. syringae]